MTERSPTLIALLMPLIPDGPPIDPLPWDRIWSMRTVAGFFSCGGRRGRGGVRGMPRPRSAESTGTVGPSSSRIPPCPPHTNRCPPRTDRCRWLDLERMLRWAHFFLQDPELLQDLGKGRPEKRAENKDRLAASHCSEWSTLTLP